MLELSSNAKHVIYVLCLLKLNAQFSLILKPKSFFKKKKTLLVHYLL